MKKSLLLAVFTAACTAVCTGLFAETTLKGQAPVMNIGVPEVIDYKGKALGSEIPAWVKAVGDGNRRKVYKSLEIDPAEDKIFLLFDKGKDLVFLKTWIDQVDARAMVATAIESTVAQTVESELKNADVNDASTRERKAKIYSASMTNLTLNGLMKEADYWIKTRTPKTDVAKPEKLSDYDVEYTYYAVFSISEKNFDRQLKAAMDDIPDNDDQTKFLKEVLTQKLKESIISNKEPELVNFKNAKVEESDDGINGVR